MRPFGRAGGLLGVLRAHVRRGPAGGPRRRAAAEALTAFTGSAFFPGGLGEFVARKDGYLIFENGPSEELRLQWATYFDAADQSGQSRIWGGIHIFSDDTTGRQVGSVVGRGAAARAQALWNGEE